MLPMIITLLQGAMTVAPAVEAAIRLRRAREAGLVQRDLQAEREVLQQTWQAYEFQTRQRNLTFGLFVAGLAGLVAAYAIALAGDLPVLAAIIALAGAGAVAFLNRLDAVHRARIRLTERAFRDLDEHLIEAGDPSRAGLVPRTSGLSQDVLMLLFQAFAFWGFVVALIYAAIEAA